MNHERWPDYVHPNGQPWIATPRSGAVPTKSRGQRNTLANVVARTRPNGGCLEWQGKRSNGGYGVVSFNGQDWKLPRLIWTLIIGPVAEGLHVLHRCDNPPCCNPAHLFLGTHQENMADRVAKGRTVLSAQPGERNPSAKLTEDQVREIRQAAADGESHRSIAPRYGVRYQAVTKIVARARWRHVA